MRSRAVPESMMPMALSQMGLPSVGVGNGDGFVLDGDLGKALRALVDDLKLARVFAERGIEAPSRALFVGPSGVGKTMAAHWIGAQLGARVQVVRIDTVVKSHLGETPAAMRAEFDRAHRDGAILFLDEIDAVSVVRSKSGDSSAGEEMARATASMFQQLDALPTERVVIAATNLVNKLDPALRRRFSIEIEFTNPGPATRAEMARLWLSKANLGREFADRLVERSDGMSGAAFRTFVMTEARAEIRKLL